MPASYEGWLMSTVTMRNLSDATHRALSIEHDRSPVVPARFK